MNLDDEIRELMARVRRDRVPSSDRIVEETFRRFLVNADNYNPQAVVEEFNALLRRVYVDTLVVLEEYEQSAYPSGIPEELIRIRPEDVREAEEYAKSHGFGEAVVWLFARWYPMLRRCFLSVAQSRKTRGGRDFELQFATLLGLAEIPFERMRREGRADFVLPSERHFQANPTTAAICSAKRTLRERWQEVVEELQKLRCPNTFLTTADDSISRNKAKAITDYRIHLVVWDHIKQSKFQDVPLVIGYSELVGNRIAALRRSWTR